MSNITESFNQRTFVTPRADFASESQQDLIKLIMLRHGEKYISSIKLIDENDDYDSFLVEILDKGFCIKISFDPIPIFYEYMILKGIEHLQISPYAIDRNQIEFGKTIYYTIQTFEYSENISSIGSSALLSQEYSDIYEALKIMHTYSPPKEVWPHLDDTESYLMYHNTVFENIIQYISKDENEEYEFLKNIYQQTFNDMFEFFLKNKSSLMQQKFVHGNLDSSTIITNSNIFKFINFENSFVGSPFFDLCNLTFEIQTSGIKEYDFITKRIKEYQLVENRFKASEYLKEYKICKYIWTRKRFLDILNEYIKEILVLDKRRIDKMSRLGHHFSNHFYRFNEIESFSSNKIVLVQKFENLILNF
jgi:hypothetical protein